MAAVTRLLVRLLLSMLVLTALSIASTDPSYVDSAQHKHSPKSSPHHAFSSLHHFNRHLKRFRHIRRPTSPHSKRGLPNPPGDIEIMGFYSALISLPAALSVMGIVTDYNMEKSYFRNQPNAEYYKMSREMAKAHAAKLIQEQEARFAKAGITWDGMIYDKNGNVNPGAKVPMSRGKVILMPNQAIQGQQSGAAAPA